MAKFRQVHTKIWADPDFQEYTSEQKILFLYLCTNPLTTESGIYPITPKSISNDTGLSLDTVIDILHNNKLKNVMYDTDNKCIFIVKFRNYNGGGSPNLISKSIRDDYAKSKHTTLWNEFVKHYPQYNLRDNGTQPMLNGLETVDNLLDNSLPKKSHSNYIKYNQVESSRIKEPLLNGLETVDKPLEQPQENVFTIYQNNIGMLTQIISEQLQSIEDEYPIEWFREAVKESVNNNARNLNYITAILKRWKIDGYKVDKRKQKTQQSSKKYKSADEFVE